MTRWSRYTLPERVAWLIQTWNLDGQERQFLEAPQFPDRCLADALIENAVGFYGLPLGVVPGITVNGKTYTVPLVTEETSVIAALQKTARWVESLGGCVEAECLAPQLMIGQIHFPRLNDPQAFEAFCSNTQLEIVRTLNDGPAASLVARGGGVKDLNVRIVQRGYGGCSQGHRQGVMGIVHLHVDVGDCMGANRVTQLCEVAKRLLSQGTGEVPLMGILSNLADLRLTRSIVRMQGVAESVGHALQEASLIAQVDPYRAVTHNKGLLNGMDALALATGNDWRALEAGLHGYAAHSGQYRGLSTWTYEEGVLEGRFTGPLQLGIRGGVTRVHPGARACLKILQVTSGQELCQVMAALGLLQNLGALRALVSEEGLSRGHMGLHLENLLLETDTPEALRLPLKRALKARLRERGYISHQDVHELRATLEEGV